MGVKSFFLEVETKVSPSRLFKALVTESHDVLPKFIPSIKSIEIVEGQGVVAGCVLQTNFHEGSYFKCLKKRFDTVDPVNYVCKFTLFLGDKIEKVSLEFVATEDGGCVIKVTNEYHTKGDDKELSDEEINAGKELALGLYTSCEEYLLALPDSCI